MATPDPAENIPNAAIDITLTAANLTWFGPDSPSHNPPAPDQAWLILEMKSQPHSIAALATGYELNYLSTLGPSQVTLTIPGQPKPVPGTIAGKGGPADESQDQSGFLGGVYYWQVPADLVAATVNVTPGAITAESNWLGSPQTITVPGSATFPLSFAAPYQPPPPPASPPADAAGTDAAALTTSTPHRSSGGFPFLTLLAIPVVLLGGGAGVLTRRRHAGKDAHHRPVSEATPAPDPADQPVPGQPPGPADDPVVPPPPRSVASPSADIQSTTPAAANGSAQPPLLDPPATPPEPPPDTVRIDVLGSTSITGWPPGPAPGQSVVEIMAFLVLHSNRRFTAEQIQTGLAIGRPRDLSAGSIRRYMNEPRRTLGEYHVPETRADEGYWLRHVTSDAAQMADLFERARTRSSPADRARLLADGLALVRGAPFAEVPSGTLRLGRHRHRPRTSHGQTDPPGGDRAGPAGPRSPRFGPHRLGGRTGPAGVAHRRRSTRDAAARLRGVPELDVAWSHTVKHLDRHGTSPSDRLRAAYHRLHNEGVRSPAQPPG